MNIFLTIFSAVIPVFFWYLVIIRQERQGMKFFFFLVFGISVLFAFIFKQYEKNILEILKNISGVFLGFVLVGIIIEYGKNFILRLFAKNYFKSLDDVVDLAFATALGFTFLENIFIFYSLFLAPFSYGTPIEIIKIMVVQEFFILPIHLICSGIFGYYYGLSLFAKPEIKNHKFFSQIQILKGTLISTLTYGIFFFLKEQNLKVSSVLHFFDYDFLPSYLDENLLPIISFSFFTVGSLFLFYKLEQKHFLTEEKRE